MTTAQSGQVLDTLAASLGTLPRVLLPDTADGATEQSLVDPSSSEMPRPTLGPFACSFWVKSPAGAWASSSKDAIPTSGATSP